MAGPSADPRAAQTPWSAIRRRPGGGGLHTVAQRPTIPANLSTPSAQDDHRRLRLLERWSICWLISAVINLVILLTAALLLIPFDRGVGPLTLIARVDAEEGELEMLSESADTMSLDFGVELELPEVDPFATEESNVSLDMAGGSFSQGPGGWQGGGGGGSGGGTDYFGTVAYGNRFVYILDKSRSMRRPSGNSRFSRAKYELLRSIDKLAPYQSFYVILFSSTTYRMFDDDSPAPVTIPATRENKQRLREWLDSIPVDGGTDPREALFLAVSIAPDAIFLLSDGDFNRVSGRDKHRLFAGDPEAEELVKRINRTRTPIHTFAYEDPSAKQRMENLAQISGGDYKYIPPFDGDGNENLARKP